PMRRARRSRANRSGHRPAARAMLRRAMGTGGEALCWRWLRRTVRPRPIVLVCDISGSMERYSRFMLRFAHALQRSGAPVEVFVFGTRLTRITRQLRIRSPDAALRRVAETVVDWSGGTRIGESLHELNRRWVRRTVRSGAVVLLVSDGWERGDPALLAREMGTLRRSCHRLLWIDPLAARPGFEPATVGLQAALPFVDELVPAASVASLEELARRLVRL
ncbi:MAG: VWA domain-containing protein, partial [Gemmatimonadota bacterium]|nr:VWA domain-containing protein [Gemmatimonadota bacterium]